MVIKASTVFTKYLVKRESPNLFSWGTILSAMQTTLVCLFFFTLLRMVPKHGPINGSQYLTTIISGMIFFNSFPTFIQLKGLTELMETFISRSVGGSSVEYCVVPGNR